MSDFPKETIHLTGTELLMMGTVILKAHDARSSDPILGDEYSVKVLERCEFNNDRSDVEISSDLRFVRWCASRTKIFDAWCQDFLDSHGDDAVTVLHLGCGLDCRYLRVSTGPNVRWIDIDQSRIVNLRTRCIPQPEGDYTLRTLQITKRGWLRDIPSDRPTLVIAEGPLVYLEPDEGRRLVAEVADYFSHGEMVFDSMFELGVRLTALASVLQSSGAVLKWGMDDVRREIEALHPKLRLKKQLRWPDYLDAHPPVFGEKVTAAMSIFPSFKSSLSINRFEF